MIAWTFYGVAVGQDDPVIRWVSLLFAALTTIHVLKPIYQKCKTEMRKRQKREQDPYTFT